MNAMKKIAAYKSNAVATRTGEQIVVMLYEGAIRFLKEAKQATIENDFKTKGEKIGKTIDIITELNAVLDLKKGGEIASDLRRSYRFMLEYLTQASFKKDPEMMQQIIDQLETLHGAWKEISK